MSPGELVRESKLPPGGGKSGESEYPLDVNDGKVKTTARGRQER